MAATQAPGLMGCYNFDIKLDLPEAMQKQTGLVTLGNLEGNLESQIGKKSRQVLEGDIWPLCTDKSAPALIT